MLRNSLLRNSLSALVLASGSLASCQSTTAPGVKQEAKNSSCSNIVALAGNVEVNCSSLTPAQQKQIESIPLILHKILVNQIDPESVMLALDEIRNRIPKLKGVLLPANDPDPLPFCKANGDELKIVLGTNAWVSPAGGNVIKVGDRDWVKVKRSEDGISVDADLVGEDQNMLGRIRDNKFVLNPNNLFDVTSDDSTLIVHSTHDGSEVLNVRFSNKTIIRINAIFYLGPGMRVEVNERGINSVGTSSTFAADHACFHNSGGISLF